MPVVALKPRRGYCFTDHAVNNPAAPPPGDRLDGEVDRINLALGQLIDFVSVSLNSDGTLKPGTVGQAQLKADAFPPPPAPVITQAATPAPTDAIDPLDAAGDAAASAAAAEMSANHAKGSENICVDYGVLTQAWAEYMPDVIPPNILAVMGVTGDHWSSRWWANRCSQLIQAGFQPSPPVSSGPLLPARIVNDTVPPSLTLADSRPLYINNAARLASLTVFLPVAAVGTLLEIGFRNPITALSVLTFGGGAIPGAPTNAYGPGAGLQFRYDTPGWIYWK